MTRLRVLLVEDSEDDALLAVRELERSGYKLTWERVQDARAMREALARTHWDLVISDWSMPQFNALAALALLKESGVDIPFIITSGTIGEETAVEAMHAGASDFLLKGNLTRMNPAVERELREHKRREVHRQTDKALRKSEDRFSKLAASGIIGVVIADVFGKIAEVNNAFARMVGYSSEELLSGALPMTELVPSEWHAAGPSAPEQWPTKGAALPWEKELGHKDGRRVPVLIAATILDETNCMCVIADLTERKRAEAALRRTEEQLRQAQKMEAIGNLAGGVAHDFNNLLSIILSYSRLLSQDMTASDPRRADLEEIENAGKRAQDLTRQLLAFGRQQILQPRVTDLNDVVAGMEKMLRRLIGEDVELAVIAARHLRKVKVDPSQIEQVIMNLSVNSRDAMPRGGKLAIETANVELDARYASDHVGATPGPHVMLAVTDTGTGMDKATQARMFEPFFTTKEKGKGTGLGLSTVFGIVQQSGGNIWVYSEPGRGTALKLYFPATDELVSTAGDSSPPPPGMVRGTETILLVEDEERVRILARTILRRFGYHVLEAQSGGDALLICEQHTAAIDLMVTDVVMPRMSGRQLAERLHSLRPEMRVLFMSGYTDNSIVHHGVLDSGVPFLQKPITPETLVQKVREVLDAPKTWPR